MSMFDLLKNNFKPALFCDVLPTVVCQWLVRISKLNR